MAQGGATRLARRRTTTAAASSPLLWRAEDLMRWAVILGIGAVAIGVSWYLAAGDATFRQQIGPVDAAVGGLLVAGLGNVGWLLRGRRALGERRQALLADRTALPHDAEQARRLVWSVRSEASLTDEPLLVAGDDMERYHRPDCALALGRSGWQQLPRRAHEAAGRQPCGVCRP